jgi:glycine dehydrogenase subunit 2
MSFNQKPQHRHPIKQNSFDSTNSSFTENRGLQIEETLIFEQGSTTRTGVDLPEPEGKPDRLGGLQRTTPIGLPGLSEPETVRHYTRLSRNNYAIDIGLYPLGSCTMKHNPRLNEKLARLQGFSDIHPLQPVSTVQGALVLIEELADWLAKITGFPTIAMSPAAGAQGELCGLMTIRSYLEHQGDPRKIVLVADSAHGTNPATATMCGYQTKSIPSNPSGRLDLEALKSMLSNEVAAVMLTNPNTCGLFEREILEISEAVHNYGALLYCDGANFNAIVGKVRPADLDIDIMHLNLHKTFSTPHGGGGPGAGPVAMTETLAPYAPLPWIAKTGLDLTLTEHISPVSEQSFGRMRAWHGQMGMFVRALAYLMSHGGNGLRQVAEDAVLNANYVRVGLQDHYSMPYAGICMHEVLCDDQLLKQTNLKTLDIAKALIDEGFHPMTIYFPLIVSGAMLIEPTETETKDTLDQFIGTMIKLAKQTTSKNASALHNSPNYAPRKRLDETRAARNPILRWAEDQSIRSD